MYVRGNLFFGDGCGQDVVQILLPGENLGGIFQRKGLPNGFAYAKKLCLNRVRFKDIVRVVQHSICKDRGPVIRSGSQAVVIDEIIKGRVLAQTAVLETLGIQAVPVVVELRLHDDPAVNGVAQLMVEGLLCADADRQRSVRIAEKIIFFIIYLL